MGTMASHITSLTIVYSSIYSGTDQRKHQSSMWGIHRWPVNSPHKWPVTRKMFPFDDVIMFLNLNHKITPFTEMATIKTNNSNDNNNLCDVLSNHLSTVHKSKGPQWWEMTYCVPLCQLKFSYLLFIYWTSSEGVTLHTTVRSNAGHLDTFAFDVFVDQFHNIYFFFIFYLFYWGHMQVYNNTCFQKGNQGL